MHKRFLPLLLLLISIGSHAQSFTPPIEVIEYIDDVKVVAYINQDDLKDADSWTPFESQPPLSINDALLSVKRYLQNNGELENTTLRGIELKRIAHHESNWHYIVKTHYKTDAARKYHFFVVLMNGKVISALREPESIK
jgi:hypothetical protein